ncbi:MAG: hypothetical protein R3D59_00250 [Paracoccaceae bacterium]|nr:hypothetical protein [Maritimibacter sp.]
MFRDFLTIPIVCLSLFGTAAQQDGDSLGLKLLAATGDSRRSMIRFLDLYAGLKAGVAQTETALQQVGGWSDFAAES